MTNVTCGLTAKKPGSAECPTLVIEYGTTSVFNASGDGRVAPRGQGPSKNRQGPGKTNWTVHVKNRKRPNANPVCSMEAGADG